MGHPTEFPKKTIAAIDIGTNSAHMVVAEMDHVGEMRILDTDKVTLRLGKEIGPDGNLSASAMARTIETLKHMREIATSYKAEIRAVATHATREAHNHKILLQEIRRTSGINVELIDGIEEARLSFLGMRYGLGLHNVPCLGVDVGGGSSEIIIATDDEIDFVSSFKIGAVTLTEKYFGTEGYTPEALEDLKEHISSRLAPLPQEAHGHTFTKALASSGTAKALAHLHARLMAGIEVSDPNGYQLPTRDLTTLVEMIERALKPSKIKEVTGLDSSRSEIILAGAIILDQLGQIFGLKEWIVTSFGLREGLVADTVYRKSGNNVAELPDIQWHSVLQFAKRLQINEIHATKVKRLALALYDKLHATLIPGATAEEDDANIKLLKAAAYLREAGKFISSPQYHRHSQYIISNSRLPGFTEPERIMMGLIVRFQRKAVPHPEHEECLDLTEQDMLRLKVFSGILRLASALDRSRQNRIVDLDAEIMDNIIRLNIFHEPGRRPDVEIHKAGLEKSALEKCFGRSIEFALIADSTRKV